MSSNVISLAEFRRLMEGGKPLTVLDVRTPAEFARVHAVGARLMPLDQLDPAAVAAQRRDADEAIYVICQSGARAAKACQRLQEAGLAKVYNIEGGTAAWEKMGLPVERGQANVISLERQVRIVAGALVLLGVALAWTVHPAFIAIAAFVGAGLMFAGITDYCGMGMILCKMPWNRR
ncbi:MAG: rhodanese-like domain-containing protein [Tepidisphaeraceae bacterium]|jgi:rhodanese-related sulfurtransferase